jgi:ParB family chromosome partitioning protein
MGHARALLAIEQEDALRRAAKQVLAMRLSVRETEGLVRRIMAASTASADSAEAKAASPKTDANTRAAEEQLRLALGTRVRILRKGQGGRVEIDFISEDELNRIYEYIIERR